MRYRITHACYGQAISVATRKQFPAALDQLWNAAYAMLGNNGLLDRPVAWRVKRTVDAITRDVHSATIKLYGDDSSTVTIERIGS